MPAGAEKLPEVVGTAETLEDAGRSKSSRRGFWGRRKPSPPKKKSAPSSSEAAALETELQAISKPVSDKQGPALDPQKAVQMLSQLEGEGKVSEASKAEADPHGIEAAASRSQPTGRSTSLEAIGARLAPLKAASTSLGNDSATTGKRKSQMPPPASAPKEKEAKLISPDSEEQGVAPSASAQEERLEKAEASNLGSEVQHL